MENNIKKKDPFEKVIVLSVVSITLCVLLLGLSYLIWGYYRHALTPTPTNVIFSLSPLIIFGCFVGTLAVYNFTSYIFKFNDVSKIKYIIGLIVSFLIMLIVLGFLWYGFHYFGNR